MNTQERIDGVYQELLSTCKVMIERDYQPCNLDDKLREIIHKLASEVVENEWTGWRIIFGGVLYATELAYSLSERYDKTLCHYLDMAIQRNWSDHYIHSFREKMAI